MKILIKETGFIKELSIIDPTSGHDYIEDFVDGSIDYDEEKEFYVCDDDEYQWWLEVVISHQALRNRICDLKRKHGDTVVDDVLYCMPAGYLIDEQSVIISQLLDEKFGNDE